MSKNNAKTYDIVFKNVKIIDGTGAPSYTGDIGVKDSLIIDAGQCSGTAEVILDCDGLYAAPGFIDMHNHSDSAIFQEPLGRNYISQGVTTLVNGNCGDSAAPYSPKNLERADEITKGLIKDKAALFSFSDYLESLRSTPTALNIASLVGHGNIRGAVMGLQDVKPGSEDMEAMKKLVREAMESGAFGMSTGLLYDPGVFADTDELVELTKVVAEYGGIYATHMRNESDYLVDSVLEAITIGQQSGARVQISHHKASGKRNWGLVNQTLELMEYYRRLGVEVTCDVYPCVFSCTDLYSLFPGWSREKGKKGFLQLIKSEEVRNKLKKELQRPGKGWENVILDAGFDEIIITATDKAKDCQGKSITRISNEKGMTPYDVIFDMLEKDPDVLVLAGGMNEEDMKYVLRHPLSMVGSDGRVNRTGDGLPHPRYYRAFTKVLTTYARDEAIMPLEAAIKKMSYMAAWKLGINNRGLIKPGFKADMAIFDLWDVKYGSEFNDPHHYSEGMVYVLVNGKFAMKDGKFTEEKPGDILVKE